MSEIKPEIIKQICEKIEEFDAPEPEAIEAEIAAFEERFPLTRLQRLSGVELLEEMHGRSSRDSLVYWLEFKKDDTFQARRHGSISGGSALKFVVYKSVETHTWHTSSTGTSGIHEVSAVEAAEIAERQRDQLAAASRVLAAISDDPEDLRYATLQADIEAAAPEFHQLAFFHKTLALWFPERLDDYHSTKYQDHILISMGIEPSSTGLYSAAGHFVRLLYAVRRQLGSALPMPTLGAALNQLYGPPVKHWRVGTGQSGNEWLPMLKRDMIAVGWPDLGDFADVVGGLSGHDAIRALKKAIAKAWPKKDPRHVGREARQIWKFYHQMQQGDRIYAAYGRTIRGIGVVEGPYFYEEDDFIYPSRRRVRWLTTTPFKVASNAGLQQTVAPLTRALDIRAAAARHLLAQGETGLAATPHEPKRVDTALAPLVAQLKRKGQIVLYGPPGTGKTYRAQQTAEEIVAMASHGRSWAELSVAQRHALKGLAEADDQRIWTCTFHPAYGYEDFVEGLRPRPVPGGLDFRPEPGLFLRICERANRCRDEQFVLLIDEFNRGDAPRIFGELLTLLELDKRERIHVELPLSGRRFTVPPNVRIIATMNTADRSISLLDAALRRRFGFVEYMPATAPLRASSVEGLALAPLLLVINERLLAALGDGARNLQVGHAYFMSEAQPITSILALRDAIRYDLFPLLQEYCAEDPNALDALLGAAFYNRESQQFRDDLFGPGKEVAFIEALIAWAPERLSAGSTEAEPEDDDDADDADDADADVGETDQGADES